MIKKNSAFTLIELLVSVVIVGILAAIAVMSYQHHIYRARRTDAIQTLYAIQLAEENYRSSHTQYGTIAEVWDNVATTANGYYSLSITNVTASSYTLTAQAQSTQTNDAENGTSCSTLTLAMSNGTTTKSPSACWLTS